MVREEGTTSEQHNHIELSLSEQIKQDFYKGLKGTKTKIYFIIQKGDH
jgi:hypothetical protein